MPEQESSIFECVEGIAKLIGMGKEIAEILGLGGDNTFDKAALIEMLTTLLAQSALQGNMNDYAGNLAAARSYFKQTYQADLDNHPIPTQPVDYANPGTASFLLGQLLQNKSVASDTLTEAASQLEVWLRQNGDSLPDQVATGVPLWIDLWIHACVFLSEEAKVSPEQIPTSGAIAPWPQATQDRPTVLKQMGNAARVNVQAIADFVLNGWHDGNNVWHDGLWQKRLAALTYNGPVHQGGGNAIPGQDQNPLPPWQIVTIHDAKFDDGASTLICQLGESDAISIAWGAIIGPVWDWYRWTLWNGDATVYDPGWGISLSTKDALRRVVSVLLKDQSERWWGGPDYIAPKNSWNSDFLLYSVQRVVDFGNFIRGVRKQLLELDLMASALTMNAEDGWSWCDQCGVLFSAARTEACPANQMGAHGQQGSGNYVMRCDPVAPLPANMQDGWRLCNRCGDLFYSDDPNANVCKSPLYPDDKWHDGTNSRNYVVGHGPIPEDAGLAVQPGWRWCNKCGVLHYYGDGTANPPAPSQCMAGGQHTSDGSGEYWLPVLGALPRSRLVYTKWHP